MFRTLLERAPGLEQELLNADRDDFAIIYEAVRAFINAFVHY